MNDAMRIARGGTFALVAAAALWSTGAVAEPLSPLSLFAFAPSVIAAPPAQPSAPAQPSVMTEDPDQQTGAVPDNLRRHIVDYPTGEPPGTIVIDTPHTYLYFVLGGGKAVRYGIGVGRDGFTWSGIEHVARKAEWPDWYPPAEMIERQPYLPRMMAGGPANPLGARAMYLGGTVYRIHGTNAPSTIGKHVSSGCIRMLNEDVIDLYNRVHVGTKVVVLPMRPDRPATYEAKRPAKTMTTADRGGIPMQIN